MNYFCSKCSGDLGKPKTATGVDNGVYFLDPCQYCLKEAEAKGLRKGRKLGKTERNISWSKKSW
jgi:hypothetical protein